MHGSLLICSVFSLTPLAALPLKTSNRCVFMCSYMCSHMFRLLMDPSSRATPEELLQVCVYKIYNYIPYTHTHTHIHTHTHTHMRIRTYIYTCIHIYIYTYIHIYIYKVDAKLHSNLLMMLTCERTLIEDTFCQSFCIDTGIVCVSVCVHIHLS
jgi:hypothetical protein